MKVAVIGSGPAGYPAALRLKNNGVDVSIIEKGDFGGTCLNRGCIPSKAILEIAKRYHEIKEIKNFFTSEPPAEPLWEKIREHKTNVVKNLRTSLEKLFAMKRIDIIRGKAKIISSKELEIETQGEKKKLNFDKLIIATGTKPFYPKPYDSIKDILLDSDTIFDIEKQPQKLTIIGAGIIGIEMACFFNAVGTEVNVIDIMPEILPFEDKSAVKLLRTSFEKRGIKFYLSSKTADIITESGKKKIILENGTQIESDAVLVAAGRTTDLKELNLESAGIKYSKFIEVNSFMQTSNPDIYACGDVNGISMLAHSATKQSEIAVDHMIKNEAEEFDPAIIPSCIYSWPEYASVGINPEKAKEKGMNVKIKKAYFQTLGKAVATFHTEGFIQLVFDENDIIKGAQILGANATEIIHTLSVAIKHKLKLKELNSVVYAHPTMSEIIMEALNR